MTRMMNLENRKGKANVPVIKKFLVDIEKPLFKAFEQVRVHRRNMSGVIGHWWHSCFAVAYL